MLPPDVHDSERQHQFGATAAHGRYHEVGTLPRSPQLGIRFHLEHVVLVKFKSQEANCWRKELDKGVKNQLCCANSSTRLLLGSPDE